jgi:hypothetical protein
VLRSLLDAPELKLRAAEAVSEVLGLAEDPEEWEAEDYKRALDETFGPSERSIPLRSDQLPANRLFSKFSS